jgi:hypothetical protein
MTVILQFLGAWLVLSIVTLAFYVAWRCVTRDLRDDE